MKQLEYLSAISNQIINKFGLNFQSNQFEDLERRIRLVANDLKIDDNLASIAYWLQNNELSNTELNILSSHLTINETYFFRETQSLELLIQQIIPELVSKRKGKFEEIRIWSAGCSSGEEPYTIAMIIKEFFPELSDWNITILATDISPVVIQKALQGEYTEWSFRETKENIKNKYFTHSGKIWKINSDIKKMITFSYLNLSKNSYPSSATNTENMDVIFCRNVLMYFTPQLIKDISKRFYNSIVEDGWLITSQVELNDEYFSDFKRVLYNKGIFYQKTMLKDEVAKPFISKPLETKTVQKVKNTVSKPKELIKIRQNISVKRENSEPKQLKIQNFSIKEIEYLFQIYEYQKCINACLQLIEKGNLDNNLFILLIKSYANSGNYDEGEKKLKKLLTNSNVTPEIYYLYASFLYENNNHIEAELILKKIIYLNHKHILSHLMLAELHQKNEKKHLALKHYQTVINMLEYYKTDEILPESDGMTVGRIKELTISLINNL